VRDAAWAFRHRGDVGLAGDVANGFKHLKRDRRENVDAAAHVSVLPGHPFRLDEARLDDALLGVLVIAGNQIWEDAADVADRCIAQWDPFLRDHGLH
jgi:hypothetical protein